RDDTDCTTVDGKCPISMDDENLRCYLIDNNGYIMVSKSYEETGRFLGEVDGTVMKKLVTMGIFQRVMLYDFQAMCRLVPDSHSSRAALGPYQSLSALVKWLITELTMLLLEFTLSGPWSPEHAATAQKVRRQDLLQPCHKQYPAFSAAPTLKENSGAIDCGDCERMFVIQQVPGSNLLLLVVDTECRCDNMFRMGLHPEDASECGGAARRGVSASTLLTVLALTSTALHAWRGHWAVWLLSPVAAAQRPSRRQRCRLLAIAHRTHLMIGERAQWDADAV
ncbi:unnamed protein product, partial [Lampetra planeri]